MKSKIPVLILLLFCLNFIIQAQDTSFEVAQAGIATQIYEQVSPSVVAINLIGIDQNGERSSFGFGSGVVYDSSGHIVTNDHVVAEAQELVVYFLDGSLSRAEVVGRDPDSDLAVIRATDVPASAIPITLGDSDTLLVGQPVLAFGSPHNQRWTLTGGMVSALDRLVPGQTEFLVGGAIQTDAAINPGNSGGPLVNINGEVIGINFYTEAAGISYAIPVNLLKRVVPELIANGAVEYAYLGIYGTEVYLEFLQANNLALNFQGVVVYDIIPGSPAQAVGLIPLNTLGTGDVITHLDGIPVASLADIVSYMGKNTVPGQTMQVTILRNGSETLTIDILLSARP